MHILTLTEAKARISKFFVSQAIDYQKSMLACVNKTTNWSNISDLSLNPSCLTFNQTAQTPQK